MRRGPLGDVGVTRGLGLRREVLRGLLRTHIADIRAIPPYPLVLACDLVALYAGYFPTAARVDEFFLSGHVYPLSLAVTVCGQFGLADRCDDLLMAHCVPLVALWSYCPKPGSLAAPGVEPWGLV